MFWCDAALVHMWLHLWICGQVMKCCRYAGREKQTAEKIWLHCMRLKT